MTQEGNTEGTEPTGESASNESPVIKELRQKYEDAKKEAKSKPTWDEAEEHFRARLARENSIQEQLVALGHPRGLSEFLDGKLEEDAEINRDTVGQALQSIGYQVEVDDAAEQSEGNEPSSQESDLARVGDLSSKVQAAASGGVDPSEALSKKIGAAENQEQLVEAMQEAGLTTKLL